MKTRSEKFIDGMLLGAVIILLALKLWEWTHSPFTDDKTYYDNPPSIDQKA